MISKDDTQTDTDLAVIGGGPAGATVATLVAQQGHRVTLFERDDFPRFHIGESLMPETYWTFKRLGVLDKLKASPYVRKYSVQFINDTGKESQPFYFDEHKPHECSITWQVLRSEFDRMMLDNAKQHGVEVHQGARVREVLFEGDRACGVRVQDSDGSTRDISCKVVADASGQSSLISSRLKLRQADPHLRKGSIWTYYRGARRESGRDEGATLVMHTEGKKGWFWYIPLPDDIVSVGVVGDFDELFGDRRDHGEVFNEQVELCMAAKERLEGAERVAEYRATKDFSYTSSEVAGPGWVLVGDAFGFLDPVYSSGVFLALKSGELAADAIVDGFKTDDLSAAQLGRWSEEYRRGMRRMRELVCAFYEGFSFGKFLRKYPQFQGHITDLLIGDLFKESVDEVFPPMTAMREEMRQAEAASRS